MTYQECLDYLFSQLPMYQRVGQAAYKADLSNTIEILKRLGNPEKGFRSIHVAGTNGKGSVSHMLAAILQRSGLKTGLYTSPHLKDFRERIKINGEMIAQDEVVEFVEKHRSSLEDIQPSFFEWTVGLAFDYFKKEKVDVAVVEVGMGGRLDSTNVLMPDLCVITNIGFDHMRFLGNDLSTIAKEKAGIIKKDIPVVVGEYVAETKPVFESIAIEKGAPLILAQDKVLPTMESDLKGPYQRHNIQTVLHCILQLQSIGYKIEHQDIEQGLKRVVSITGLHGRWEWISQEPRILADVAHNKEGLLIVFDAIQKLEYGHLHIVWGMVDDKDIPAVLDIVPKDAIYYFCRPNIPRGLKVEELAKHAEKCDLTGEGYHSVRSALQAAKAKCKKGDLIFVGGSTFVVAEALP